MQRNAVTVSVTGRFLFITIVMTLALFISNHNSVFASTEKAPLLLLNDHDGKYDVGTRLEYLEDPYHSFTFEEVLRGHTPSFQASPQQVLNLGFTNSAYWLRFTVNGDHISTPKRWIAEISYPTINRLNIYIQDSKTGVFQETETGTDFPFSQKPISHRNFLFHIDLEPGEQKTIYFRAEATNALQIPVTIWDQRSFDQSELIAILTWGGFFGMMLVMTLYNLFIFLSVKDKSYLYYILYINSIACVVLGLNGLGFEILWPDNPDWNRLSLTAFAASMTFFAIQFGRHFLHTPENAPVLDVVLNIQSACALILIPLSIIFREHDFSSMATVLVLSFAVVILASGFYCLKQGVRSAKYFLTAWVLYLTGLCLFTLTLYSVLPVNFITVHAKEFGAALEMMLLSLGLADRINTEKKEKIRALESQNEAIQGMKLAERRLYHKALHDDITNLPNRKMLQREMPSIIDSALRSSTKLAVIIMRLNRLHEIYNTLGPQSKENLFKLASNRLTELLSNFDSVITLEKIDQRQQQLVAIDDRSFAFIFKTTGEKKSSKELESYLIDKLYAMSQPFDHRGMSIDLDIGIGISFVPEHGLDIDSLLQHAEVAVESSALRQPQIMVYSPNIDPYSAKRLSLMGELRDAINENRLLIEFQPQLDLTNNTIVAAEALLRWYHPIHGHIPPDETIRMAEQSGQLKPLTQWILDNTLRHAKTILKNHPNMVFCLNISSKNLREPDLIEEISNRLMAFEIDPTHINIEITESEMMEEPDLALTILTKLAEKGIRISIDDFGTGYSSLAYLSSLPVDELKIDKNFVQAMRQQEKQMAIVQATITMSHNLGLKVVAEGVEDLDNLNILRSLGCDVAQGYFISRPIPGQQFADWINRTQSKNKRNFSKNFYPGTVVDDAVTS